MHAQSRESQLEEGQGQELSNPSPSDILLPAQPYFQSLPKWCHQLGTKYSDSWANGRTSHSNNGMPFPGHHRLMDISWCKTHLVKFQKSFHLNTLQMSKVSFETPDNLLNVTPCKIKNKINMFPIYNDREYTLLFQKGGIRAQWGNNGANQNLASCLRL